MPEPQSWEFVDARVLASLASTPRATVANADRLNHAIPTLDELELALSRLVGSGLVEPRDGWYEITPLGRRVVIRRPTDYDGVRIMQSRLPDGPVATDPSRLDDQVWGRAVDDYRRPTIWRRWHVRLTTARRSSGRHGRSDATR